MADFSNIFEFKKIAEFFQFLFFVEPSRNLKKNEFENTCYDKLEQDDDKATEDPWVEFKEWKIKQKECHIHQVS